MEGDGERRIQEGEGRGLGWRGGERRGEKGTRPMLTTMYTSKPPHKTTFFSPGNLQNSTADISTY